MPPPIEPGNLPPLTLDGWYTLHQLFRIPGPTYADPGARSELGESLGAWIDGTSPDEHGWSGAYRTVAGNGVDLLLLHFRQDLDQLTRAQAAVRSAPFAATLELAQDYLSVVELSLYAVTATLAETADAGNDPEAWDRALEEAAEEQMQSPYVRGRLYPTQPDDMPHICCYPMSKRRGAEQNWYRLPLAERADMMREHGTVGRRYAGRISQIIGGSAGLDDWEWAVTLFARDPLDFKRVVTEMRYDRASTEYAEFGPFYVGTRVHATDIEEWLSERPIPPR